MDWENLVVITYACMAAVFFMWGVILLTNAARTQTRRMVIGAVIMFFMTARYGVLTATTNIGSLTILEYMEGKRIAASLGVPVAILGVVYIALYLCDLKE